MLRRETLEVKEFGAMVDARSRFLTGLSDRFGMTTKLGLLNHLSFVLAAYGFVICQTTPQNRSQPSMPPLIAVP